jgi:hypothetical protein
MSKLPLISTCNPSLESLSGFSFPEISIKMFVQSFYLDADNIHNKAFSIT